ncbi:DUF4189 domain-containing protein [Pseudochrobactrum algeriensis]|uniref:DUF4189 domain-containing protein n=1 Tax=Pseudochrobactrum algeriensis TaxID=2834768 RepID=UPI001BCE067E|nr:DUF4189 domain-containing protein [Pseudochrobactrum algeriensis]QVQ36592.1 DUF4189 domain-containing protein [Pseudochrobactrum algeriensis]QVQ39808.1 DUF4189 domain-containing protein [Pseudochrobactrum algeriensis]QVQ43729.1 DUF4189 domain-containing protein [Pseudochrobactrum algeriensis]
MKRILLPLLIALGTTTAAFAADIIQAYQDVPVPPSVSLDERGIWGAIAYSESDGKYGFFWGADKRNEADSIAQKHCENNKGTDCSVVTTFRNHRHWNDDDNSGFPYKHCAALALGAEKNAPFSLWGAASAETRKDAEVEAIQQCESKGASCKIKEWACT